LASKDFFQIFDGAVAVFPAQKHYKSSIDNCMIHIILRTMVRPAMLPLCAVWFIHLHTTVTAALLSGSCAQFGLGLTRKIDCSKTFGRLCMKAVSSSSYYPPQRESGERKQRRLLEAKVRARFLDGENITAFLIYHGCLIYIYQIFLLFNGLHLR
jgi:hypothetical protein